MSILNKLIALTLVGTGIYIGKKMFYKSPEEIEMIEDPYRTLFNRAWDTIINEVEFDEQWLAANGYYGAAVRDKVDLHVGSFAKCISHDGKVKFIFLVTETGNVVFYEHNLSTEKFNLIASRPKGYRDLPKGAVLQEDFERVVSSKFSLKEN